MSTRNFSREDGDEWIWYYYWRISVARVEGMMKAKRTTKSDIVCGDDKMGTCGIVNEEDAVVARSYGV
jgi:hypothetical protein